MNRSYQPQTRLLLTGLCSLVLLGATLLWILNLEGIVAGSWATILSVLCTILSVLFAFLHWQMPFSSRATVPSPSTPFQNDLSGASIARGMNTRRGALVVKARKKDLGTTFHLCSGFTSAPLTTNFAANVTERKSRNGSMFIAFFPTLKPGNYTIFLQTSPLYTFVTIYAGQVTDIDWRMKDTKPSSKGGNFASH